MTSLNKKSFFLQFLFYFSIALILLGLIQGIFGTLRLYNASEESYEKLAPEKIYTLSETTKNIPKQTLPEEEKSATAYYVAGEKNSIQEILQGSPPEKNITIEQEKENVVSTKKEKTKKIPTSPVQISITPEENSEPKGYKETILTVVTGKYFRDTLWKFPIIIDTERVEPRWQMYNESITLGSKISTLSEVSKVLVHEIGHMIDIYTFKKNLKKSDISEEFYKISWKDPTTIKAWVPQASFISGYASTNQYEDFAESFTMYIFHNKEFLKRAQQNDYLKQKYNFLKTRVFWDAFLLSAYEQNTVPKKVWDVTKIGIRWNNIEVIFAWIHSLAPYKS
jgi:hypothetical protein